MKWCCRRSAEMLSILNGSISTVALSQTFPYLNNQKLEKIVLLKICVVNKFVRSVVQMLMSQFCMDKVYELHPTALHKAENSPLHGHKYSTPTLKQRGIKERRIVEDASCPDKYGLPENLWRFDEYVVVT